jgi:hypothetical protein
VLEGCIDAHRVILELVAGDGEIVTGAGAPAVARAPAVPSRVRPPSSVLPHPCVRFRVPPGRLTEGVPAPEAHPCAHTALRRVISLEAS